MTFIHNRGVAEVVEGEGESALLVRRVAEHAYVGVDNVGLPLKDVQESLTTEFTLIAQVQDGVNAQTHILLVHVELSRYVHAAETVDDFDTRGQDDLLLLLTHHHVYLALLQTQHHLLQHQHNFEH